MHAVKQGDYGSANNTRLEVCSVSWDSEFVVTSEFITDLVKIHASIGKTMECMISVISCRGSPGPLNLKTQHNLRVEDKQNMPHDIWPVLVF